MYCRGLSLFGQPCCNKVTCTESKYCSLHTGVYVECPICYEDMQNKLTLRCGHTFCIKCLKSWRDSSCPHCRKNTNLMSEFVQKTINICAQYVDLANSDELSDEDKIKAVIRYIVNIFNIHNVIFKSPTAVDIIERKINDLLNNETVVKEHPIVVELKERLESYKESLKQ